MLKIYKILIKNAKAPLLWLLKRRVRAGKEDPARLNERKGVSDYARPDSALVWIHAASVGESQSALSLVKQILKRNSSCHVLVTTGTVTSAELMKANLPDRALHQFYPLDHPDWVESFLNHWRPDIAIWIESELWPNMLAAVKARNIKSFLVNARLSARSFKRWGMFKGPARSMLSTFTAILAQTEKDAARFTALGAQHVQVSGNLKYSAKPLPVDEETLRVLQGQMQGRLCWVYASSHKGEEELACRVHQTLSAALPDLLTIIVPRHPERGADIARALAPSGLRITRRSSEKEPPTLNTQIYIADTLGELGLFYRLAPVALIGRSFSDDGGGGHNPIEAAQLSAAVLHGPHIQYQQEIYDDMNAERAALMMKDEDMLAKTLHSFLTEPQKLNAQQDKGRAFAKHKEGVLERVMSALAPHVEEM